MGLRLAFQRLFPRGDFDFAKLQQKHQLKTPLNISADARIDKVVGKGLGVVARRDTEPATTLYSEPPVAVFKHYRLGARFSTSLFVYRLLATPSPGFESLFSLRDKQPSMLQNALPHIAFARC